MAEYPIGRVAVVEEGTGKETPIDARTRAEAVAAKEAQNLYLFMDGMSTEVYCKVNYVGPARS